MLIRRIVTPVQPCVVSLKRMSKGDLHTEVGESGAATIELIEINNCLNEMREHNLTVISDVDYMLGSMANGDFTVTSRVPDSYQGDFENILQAENTIKNQLATTLTEILQISEQVSAGSEQVSNGAQTLAQGATGQAANQISQSIGQVAAVVHMNSATSEESAAASEELSSQANVLKNLVGQFRL